MSFSSETKAELVKLKIKSQAEKRAVLCALTYSAGSMTLGKGGVGIQYTTESETVGELIAKLAGELYQLEAAVRLTQSHRLRARNTVVRLSGQGCRALLLDAGLSLIHI